MWSADRFLNVLYDEYVGQQNHPFNSEWQADLKTVFQKKLGDFKKYTQPANPVLLEKVDMGDYERLRVEIDTVSSMKMPVYVLIPKNIGDKKVPAVLAVHGHGYGSRGAVGLAHDGSIRTEEEYHKDFAIELVKRGMVVVVPELIGFGERKLQADKDSGSPIDNSCYMISSQLLLMGKTIAGLRIQECRQVIDYMQALKEIDGQRIGCMGISGGGLVAAFTSALDDRIKATVVSGYTSTFKGSIMDRRHCLDNYIPGILEYAEMPELIGLIAPRPLFIEAGKDDHLFPVRDVLYAIDKLKHIYSHFEAEELVHSHIFAGGHEINGEESFDWLETKLKKG